MTSNNQQGAAPMQIVQVERDELYVTFERLEAEQRAADERAAAERPLAEARARKAAGPKGATLAKRNALASLAVYFGVGGTKVTFLEPEWIEDKKDPAALSRFGDAKLLTVPEAEGEEPYDLGKCVDAEEMLERITSWRTKPTGRYAMIVGYVNRTRVNQKKDGTWDLKRLGDAVLHYRQAQLDRKRRDEVSATNHALVKALEDELGGYVTGAQVTSTLDPDNPVEIRLYPKQVTVERARELIAALVALDLVKVAKKEG